MNDELLTALENERRYVARELHDGVAQTTLQLGLQAGICRKLLEHGKLEMLAGELAKLEERIQTASGQVRALIADMRPPDIEPDARLRDYLQQVIDIHLERGGPAVEIDFDQTGDTFTLSEAHRLALARVVQEALLNIRKHARAENVELKLGANEAEFFLTVTDDGQGFDPADVQNRPTDKGGAGLANLRVRIEEIGGDLSIDSGPEGTHLTVTWSRFCPTPGAARRG
jgi:two-component system sensor histidine kinase DegS